MPKKPKELEAEILAKGWVFKNQTGSHRHYIHPDRPGKVTIPDLPIGTEKSIRKQAGLI